ncbi:MAG: NAD(P)/FAD-dependent oxidoreductase [Calditrichia bacterium]
MKSKRSNHTAEHSPHRVIIIGGGFGGLYAARILGNTPLEVILIDRRNYHLFQPLLYQVATGGLSPGDIASPIRAVLRRYRNIQVLKGEVGDIDPETQRVITTDKAIPYDSLIVAVGAQQHYFGHDEWAKYSPGLKGVEDALKIRRRIFSAFEAAERCDDPRHQEAYLTFVIIGGGATGVELAGTLGELAHTTLKRDFRRIDPTRAKIILLEGGQRILPAFPPELSRKAERALGKLGVTIKTKTMVTKVEQGKVHVLESSKEQTIAAETILWAAGIKIHPLARELAERTSAETDKMGRIVVSEYLTIPGFDNIFVIGDMAHFSHQTGEPLPGIAPIAMQQGRYAARTIINRLKGKKPLPFHYFNKGNLAVIGRNAAVAQFGRWKFSGWLAWLIWVFVHIAYLIEFDNKFSVLFQWAYNYFTRKRGARLITMEECDS